MLHKCECGNEWLIKPKTILTGQLCGCGKLKAGIEKYRNKETILYYIKVDNKYKIGLKMLEKQYSINENIIKRRYRGYDNKFIILQTKTYIDGAEAFLLEQDILKKHNDCRYMYISKDMNDWGWVY